jgi:hypothetical protein
VTGVPYKPVYFVGVQVGKGVPVIVAVGEMVKVGERIVGDGDLNIIGVGNVCVE